MVGNLPTKTIKSYNTSVPTLPNERSRQNNYHSESTLAPHQLSVLPFHLSYSSSWIIEQSHTESCLRIHASRSELKTLQHHQPRSREQAQNIKSTSLTASVSFKTQFVSLHTYKSIPPRLFKSRIQTTPDTESSCQGNKITLASQFP